MAKTWSYYYKWYMKLKGQRHHEQREKEYQKYLETHVGFLGEFVEKPTTFSGWAEMGKLQDVLGMQAMGWTDKSAEELRELASQMDDLGVDLGRLKNPDRIAQRILEAAYEHNRQKAESDREWAINVLGLTPGKNRDPYVTGKARMEILGVQEKHYMDKDAAKKWYRGWVRILHPDNNNQDPRAEVATRELTRIYKSMTK